MGQAAVGLKQNRAIGISPDGSRLYSWKITSNGTPSMGLAVLNSADLTEITAVPLPDSCVQNSADIAVHPDGRVYLSGCNEGLYVINPSTLSASLFTQVALAHARRSELSPAAGTPLRRWVGTTAIGGASDVIGLDTVSEFALTGRLDAIRKQQLSTDGAVIAPLGSNQALAGVWRKTDIVFTDELFRDGLE